MTTTSCPSRVSARTEQPALQNPLAERLEVTGRRDPHVGARRERPARPHSRSGWRGPRRYRPTRPAAAHRAGPRRFRPRRPRLEFPKAAARPPARTRRSSGRPCMLKFRSTRIVCTSIVVKPVSMPCRCRRPRTASIAAIINTNDNATCPATSPLRRRHAARREHPRPNGGRTTAPPPPPSARRWRRPPHRRRPPRSSRDRQESSYRAARKTVNALSATCASSRPSSTPAQTADTFSASSCDAMRRRVAPSAERSCISRQRRVKRVSVRFPTLTQAISSTSAAAATRSSNVGRSSCRISAASDDAVATYRPPGSA